MIDGVILLSHTVSIKLLVKKAKPLEDLGYMRPSWNNRYYVLEVLEEHAKHSELEALSAYLKTPKYLILTGVNSC